MFNPGKIFIGGNVAYTATPVLRGSTQSVNAGNIFVLDKDMAILSPGSTVSDSDHIYLAQILSDTVTYANPAGTSITEYKMIVSNPIYGNNIKNVTAKGFVAPTAKAMAFTVPTTVVGAEYQVKLRYLDLDAENIPDGQFSATYNYVATSTTNTTSATAIAALINADPNARVTASVNSATVTLTAKTITETLNSIGKYRFVNFDCAFGVYYDSVAASYLTKGPGRQLTTAATVSVSAVHSLGQGTWREVRDLEKTLRGFRGVTNNNQFPQVDAYTTWSTVKDAQYNLVTIKSDIKYDNASNQNDDTGLTTTLALVSGASQNTNILNALNPWLNSVGIANITF